MRSKRWVLMAAAAVAGSTVVGLPALAGAAPGGDLPVTLNVVRGKVGDQIAVRGEGCLIDGQPGSISVDLDSGMEPARLGSATPDAAGSWIVTASIPERAWAGTHDIVVYCASGRDTGSFTYRRAPFEVLPQEVPTPAGASISANPTTVAPAEEVTLRGTGCVFGSKPGAVNVFRDVASSPIGLAAKVEADGSWTATVAATVGPEEHFSTSCSDPAVPSRFFWYPKATVKVTPPTHGTQPGRTYRTTPRPASKAATAVRATPAYTG